SCKRSNRLTFDDYKACVHQRIIKYPLMIKKIAAYTNPGIEFYPEEYANLIAALEVSTNILKYINKASKDVTIFKRSKSILFTFMNKIIFPTIVPLECFKLKCDDKIKEKTLYMVCYKDFCFLILKELKEMYSIIPGKLVMEYNDIIIRADASSNENMNYN
ncbi:hypothetical protein MXB_3815, partial [Myxobolus squamalis]